MNDENLQAISPRKNLEGEYLDFETKIITTFSVVESIKKQFYTQNEESSRKGDPRVIELFNALEQIKDEFESIERPTLKIETPTRRAETPSKERNQRSPSPTFKQAPNDKVESIEGPTLETDTPTQRAGMPYEESPPKYSSSPTLKQTTETLKGKEDELSESPTVKGGKTLDAEAELLKLESEFEKDRDYSTEEIGDWEFDELEKELKSSDSSSTKLPQ
uniref:Uncharacterized protein n=2 Tax=Davidia involucrata TaxID=16924 RepID=A0A5B6ZL88_DAVIN